ncbi:MAG: ThiF family adenylyltransferase [Winogradskyella sp.]|uniref:ThiF family adenylyltransferase n=1 Tax=Winogradskyella sp. TaxID=1883156 RepID=UPI00385C43D1
MSLKLINHSPDIKKLRDQGYEVEIIGNYLLVHSVPLLNASKKVVKGTLVTNVSIANNRVTKPNTHVIHFAGEFPCNIDGTIIAQIKHASNTVKLAEGITVNHSFSNKPVNGYPDYFEKVTQYIKIISAPAQHFDSSVTAQTYRAIKSEDMESVLTYSDTNSSKAEIDVINQKLSGLKIGIIGLGGTGSYILDFVAKTLVGEIHLFDGDKFLQHNAFRAPSAPSLEELNESTPKVEYYSRIYSKMHRHIVPHELYINKTNLGLLNDLDFVFVCIDRSEAKKGIFKKLESLKISFIDTGIGVKRVDDSLIGMVRTTASTQEKRSHVWEGRVSFDDVDDAAYSTNIQIAELNALNAVFAVMKWKKLYGFLNDLENEHNSTYSINVNHIENDDS